MLIVAVNLLTIFFTFLFVRDLGLFMLSICINIGIFSALGFERIWLSWVIVIISTIGFLVAMVHPFERLSSVLITKEYTEKNLIFSFCITNIATALIVHNLLKANYKIETLLYSKEQSIERKNEELKKVNHELDKFFYSASHDMRAPLTSMKGLIQLMEMNSDPEENKKYIKLLSGRIENLDRFIKSITEYSSNSRQQIVLQRLSLRNVIIENLENFKFYPRASEVKIKLEVASEIIINSDPIRLQIIFGNILSNAFKYHDFNKEKPFILVHAKLQDSNCLVTIQDNGTGIREENIHKIFGMFYRAHRQVEGTGLGLFIAKETMDKLGGEINVTSTYGEGTTFHILLPLNSIEV